MTRSASTTGPSPSAANAKTHNPDRGARIKAIRTERGWTQRQLADNLGAHVRSVQYWEAGRGPIDYPYLQALAAVGQTTIEWIEHGTTTPQPVPGMGDLEARVEWVETRARQHDTIVRYGFQQVAQEVKAIGEKVEALERQIAALTAAVDRLRR